LSNTTAGNFLAKLDSRPEEVFLAHLSQQNNTRAIALKTVQEILTNAKENQNIKIYVASQQQLVSNRV
jgi:phosphoribosyl 1,2-cyclic phosphodiesterase